jgi:Z1 domain
VITNGPIYSTLLAEEAAKSTPYDPEALKVIFSTVTNLQKQPTSSDRPGMLLGMIQSGKTRTFLGVIALAADNGFDLFIVLTKGTKALTTQTYERLKKAYETPIDSDDLRVFDIMTLPKLTPREQRIPLIIVAKKEKRNLERLNEALFNTYPFALRRTLIIDDEADFASVGFRRPKGEQAEVQAIMKLIAALRNGLQNSSFLQVTATPYSLYLQPAKQAPGQGPEFRPVRPTFTELVPIHDKYVGGKVYFEDSQEPDSVASAFFTPVKPEELATLHHSDRRKFRHEEALTHSGIDTLRHAVVTFIVGGVVRRLQAKHAKEKPGKYSFIIHTESSRNAHAWQENIIDTLIAKIREAAEGGTGRFVELVQASYDDIAKSIGFSGGWMPSFAEVLDEVSEDLSAVQVEKVNTDNEVKNLLDRDGQLELRNKLNIFIGGKILDRGLTIRNLIGFYYGRRANRFQQDTVLQHARMYGARPKADLAVTRFYTSAEIYQVMAAIHEFDAGLRAAILAGGHSQAVVFIRKEGSTIIPCSPNKILLSTLTTLRAGKRLLPVGFQTGYKTHILKTVHAIDDFVMSKLDPSNPDAPILISLKDADRLIDLVRSTFEDKGDFGYEWDVEAFKASMEYVSNLSKNPKEKGNVFLLARRDRDSVRIREGGRPFNAPDTAQREGAIAKDFARTAPMLMMFRQKGGKENGWRDCPFWWPVLYMPQEMGTVVFASDVNDYDEDV